MSRALSHPKRRPLPSSIHVTSAIAAHIVICVIRVWAGHRYAKLDFCAKCAKNISTGAWFSIARPQPLFATLTVFYGYYVEM